MRKDIVIAIIAKLLGVKRSREIEPSVYILSVYMITQGNTYGQSEVQSPLVQA